ncbi:MULTISPECIES: hypothetical protein [Streptomyces]|uniref:Uncharacterized protein n=1 Tax=Streptomyces griseus subsp. griseus (strain JCM 4626 / CBS 651.72 / NBRC 13350 / KCC S-0626 / ISP 5235) TaxID=455632 RepID=B1VMW1_STRGG|nr:hypothetical protein [Streptomyces griseus]MBW3709349.1 hypothetical protein [Streptomyces griseus]NEB50995.1 hypothetical protein [Streptomyces griseus]SEE31292.1 hypothetical protein SAMN04490359_2667 [Streptomyces griseus]SQA25226.1 Uncharacterised protein [Streptomyces griseus]BAG23586.1 conserved hypothetical protein [Streptomyces griseus subsp. griseus NBRC 13350]
MNSTPEQSGEDHPADREVVVSLSRCDSRDARTVFDVLATAFASDHPMGETPVRASGPRPTVWVTTVDVSQPRAAATPARLTEPVTVEAQGGYRAVDRLRTHLAGAFAVSVVGTAAGDQEQEVRLRLESR